MDVLRIAMFVLLGMFATATVRAVDVAKEFSAIAIQQAPGCPLHQAKMYVSKDAVRTDSKINNVEVIEIAYPAKLTQVLLIPKDKIYLERKSEKLATIASSKNQTDKPCAGRPDTSCSLLGEEVINGRKTKKWEFVATQNGRKFRSLHWIDEQRQMPIREFFADGTVTELKMLGNEIIGGRKAEKWSMTVTRADGQSMESIQWYDPELKITIREEIPGGYIRELREIKTGEQKKSLFDMPKDFQKVAQLPAYISPQRSASGARCE